eukprot:gene557-519_t
MRFQYWNEQQVTIYGQQEYATTQQEYATTQYEYATTYGMPPYTAGMVFMQPQNDFGFTQTQGGEMMTNFFHGSYWQVDFFPTTQNDSADQFTHYMMQMNGPNMEMDDPNLQMNDPNMEMNDPNMEMELTEDEEEEILKAMKQEQSKNKYKSKGKRSKKCQKMETIHEAPVEESSPPEALQILRTLATEMLHHLPSTLPAHIIENVLLMKDVIDVCPPNEDSLERLQQTVTKVLTSLEQAVKECGELDINEKSDLRSDAKEFQPGSFWASQECQHHDDQQCSDLRIEAPEFNPGCFWAASQECQHHDDQQCSDLRIEAPEFNPGCFWAASQ